MLCALGDMRLLFVIVAVQRCQFPESQDLSLFGAPCVDDSLMGPQKLDKGEARRVS